MDSFPNSSDHLGRHGALRRADALARLGRYRVERAQRLGTWLAPWPGVLVEASRGADPLTLAAAAVALADHPEAVVAGPTAAHLHGLAVLPPTPVHLQVPYGHWLRSRGGLRVHNGPGTSGDRTTVDGLPVLALTRVLADLVCTVRPADAVAVVDAALARVLPADRETFRSAVATQIRLRRDPRGTVRGPHLLDLATGRAESPAESRLLWQIVDAGFPIPEVNHVVADLDGTELYRIDLAWPGHCIGVEYQGYAAHVGRAAGDRAREDDLRRRGWTLVIVWADDARGRYEPRLDDAFRSRGLDMSRRQRGVLSGRRHRDPWAMTA